MDRRGADMLNFTVNAETCTRCGECALDCPVRIIEQPGEGVPYIKPEEEDDCMRCQHCLAVCPVGAISILGRNPEQSLPLDPAKLPTLEQMGLLVRGRRTCRRYLDVNVDPDLLSGILAHLCHAPTGVNRQELTFRVIDDKEDMRKIRETTLNSVLAAREAGTLPEGAAYLHSVASRFYSKKLDILFRGAPHALIISAPADAPCPEQDVTLALAYFELMANSAGLGTVWWGLLKMALGALPELKPLFGIPDGHVYYAMLFGVPAFRYQRTTQRDGQSPIVRITAP
jgi:nitroreductase/NAD-dependent dihydropyrimidine dehydrogenase PreA subunit